MPKTVPTLCIASFLHGVKDRLLLRVYVPLRDVHVAVSREVGERPRVHVRGPAREAGVSKRIQLEACESLLRVAAFFPQDASRHANGLGVLLLQAGAVSWRLIALMLSENPFGPKV